MSFDYDGDAISDSEKQLLDLFDTVVFISSDEDQEDKREVRTTCDNCGKNLYTGDEYWGNNQIGTFCEECAEKEIEMWWGIIY